jgi:hypothetical protein
VPSSRDRNTDGVAGIVHLAELTHLVVPIGRVGITHDAAPGRQELVFFAHDRFQPEQYVTIQNSTLRHRTRRTTTLGSCLLRLQRRLDVKLAALSRHITSYTVHEAHTAARRLRALLRAYKAELSPLQAHRYRRA